MKKLLIAIFIPVIVPVIANAASISSRLSGNILLDVERNGEAWYVWPENNLRYYLGRPADAFKVMRELGLGITDADFQRIAQAGMPVEGDVALAKRLSGRIVLQVEQNGEAWYVYPEDLKKYYLGRPDDAFRIMRELGLGITREDLALVHKPGLSETLDPFSSYERKTIATAMGSFKTDIVTIDLSDPFLRIVTAAAYTADCDAKCPARSLAKFAVAENAFAGINGTYFDTSAAKLNYYFFPLYDSATGLMVNEDQLKYWTTGPIMAWDVNNKFYYYKDSREFPYSGWKAGNGETAADSFKRFNKVGLAAMLGNKPRLIENGMNLLIEWDIDDKQVKAKAARNAIAYKDNKVYLVVAYDATVPELAEVMTTMGVQHALNLDGGYSTALWYNGEYMAGPGRDVVNAILFKKK